MIHARILNEQIQIFSTKLKLFDANGNQITGLQYFKESDYASCGFKLVIDATITDNQHLSEVIERDGKFYRDAIDNPIPVKMFDVSEAKVQIRLLFKNRIFELDKRYSIIEDNLNPILSKENKALLNDYSTGLCYQENVLTVEELTAFRGIFTSQGVEFDITK